MGRVTLTIHIDYPDGATVTPYQGVPTNGSSSAGEGPLDEAPWPDSVPAQNGTCPIHHVPWKTVPAGVSKNTGKPYDAFRTCPEMGCKERPR